MTVYFISKYALSSGVQVVDLPTEPDASGHIWHVAQSPWIHHSYSKGQWHLTHAEAEARAHEMRLKRIKSLQKQIATLEKLKFDPRPAELSPPGDK